MKFDVVQNGVRLFCRITGNGPLLLLIHGIGCDSGFFDETAAVLAEKFTVITYDRRGYGQSDRVEIDKPLCFGLREQVEDAAAILRYVNRGPALVAASSAGGLIGLALVAEYPQLVRLACLHEPPILLTPKDARSIPEFDQWLDEMRMAGEKGSESRMLKSFIWAMGGVDPQAPATDLEQLQKNILYLKQFIDCEMAELFIDHTGTRELSEEIRRKYLQQADKVVVSVGSQDKEGIFHQTGKLLAGEMGFLLVSIPGFHNVAREQPFHYAMLMERLQRLIPKNQ